MPSGVYERKPGMMNFGKTHAMRASMVRRYKAGMSLKEIGLRFGVHEWTVWKVVHESDWHLYRGKGKATKKKSSESEPPPVIRAKDLLF
jgi:transposase